jgi:formylglycine-generating enzyme required for sulfatase activity
MRTWQRLVLMAGLLAVGGLVRADGTPPPPKAWEVPGTKAGDEITGPDGGKMVWVPAGELMMGADDIRPAVHQIQITKGFWLGKCTVTNAQYAGYCHEAGVDFPAGSDQVGNFAVVGVSWLEAKAYCRIMG